MASANATTYDLPPLPEYTLKPLTPLVSWTSDALIQAALPVVGYWVVSLIFHAIDVYDLFPQFRLHTPAEVLKRNHVSRYEVLRDVVLQQIIQIVASFSLSLFDEAPTTGKADYDVAWYAQKLRLAQRAVPYILSTAGLDPVRLATKLNTARPTLASVAMGGRYPGLLQTANDHMIVPAFAAWELKTASFVYWFAIPAIQFAAAIIIIDAWEYMLHRAMHLNKWLYVTFHSRHHRLYVPYAYGALYNHPLEGFAMDTLGAGLAYLLTGMTMRQSMWFFTGSTIKTVLDHGGYDFPWDPVHWIFPNNAAYHDIHHQSWGIKTNFSQPFFVYLDRVGGTMYKGDIKEKYERARKTAQQKLNQEREDEAKAAPAAEPASLPPLEQENTVPTQSISTPHIPRKKATSMSSPAVNFKVSTNKSNSNLSGRGAKLLGQKPVQHQSRETLRSDPFTFDHRDDKIHVLLCASGSVATIKIPNMINALARHGNVRIRLIFTTAAANFLQGQSAEQPSIADIEAWPNVDGVYFDADEWAEPWVRGNKILHIELRRWADIMVIAPFSANELAKLTQGRSDNLLLSVARAWDTTGLIDPVRDIPGVRWPEEQTGARRKKRILVAPSMNTAMWFQPITKQQVHVLEEEWGAKNGGWVEVLQPMEKELACGDIGGGAMKDWRDIVSIIEERLGLSSNSAA